MDDGICNPRANCIQCSFVGPSRVDWGLHLAAGDLADSVCLSLVSLWWPAIGHTVLYVMSSISAVEVLTLVLVLWCGYAGSHPFGGWHVGAGVLQCTNCDLLILSTLLLVVILAIKQRHQAVLVALFSSGHHIIQSSAYYFFCLSPTTLLDSASSVLFQLASNIVSVRRAPYLFLLLTFHYLWTRPDLATAEGSCPLLSSSLWIKKLLRN